MLNPSLALAAVFLSGFAALLYQVIWQRLLVFFSGADVHSVTLIVAAFMAGLGIGNLTGGHIADRVTARQNLWLFSAAELAIGAFGLISKPFYYDFLYQRMSYLASSPLADGILFASLLWPTFFMGVSLPLLARALTRELAAAGRVVGSLYGFNTLGAAIGAFATTWLLVPRFGLAAALPIGAALNFVCAIAGAYMAMRTSGSGGPVQSPAVQPLATAQAEAVLPFRAWTVVYGITGFTALAMEIVWFRLLGVMLKSTAFTFGTMLSIYLMGLGAGAAAGSLVVSRSRHPGRTFLALQTVLILFSGMVLALFVDLVSNGSVPVLAEHFSRDDYPITAAVQAVVDVFSGTPRETTWPLIRQFLGLFALLPTALIGLPTLLLGFSFPFLQKAVQADPERLGRRVGTIMTANIAGSAIGALLTGLLVLPQAGTAVTLQMIVALAAVPGFLWAWSTVSRPRRMGIALTVAGAIAFSLMALPNRERLWAALHGIEARRIIAEEDGAGVTVLKAGASGFDRRTVVFANGLMQSWIPFGNVHTVLGALPAVLHPQPADIALIGLGSGDTAFSVGGRAETRSIVCIEIRGGQRRALERLQLVFPHPGLVSLLGDRRIEYVVDDGRAYLLQSNRRFDIIEADTDRPATAYSGNLYSREYFELLRSRLKTGGLAVTWTPTERVARTFVSVFPYVVGLRDFYLGSNEPITIDSSAVDARLRDPAFLNYYAAVGIDIVELLSTYLKGEIRTFHPDSDRPRQDDLNSDLFPRDEFTLAQD